MKCWKSLVIPCIIAFVALTNQAFALSPQNFMAPQSVPNEVRFMIEDTATAIPESGPLRDTLNSLDKDSAFQSIWMTLRSTIQNVSVLVQKDGDVEKMMAAALMVPDASPDALLDTIASGNERKSFELEEPVEGLTAHSSFSTDSKMVYTALYQKGDETFLLMSSSIKLLGEMAKQSDQPLEQTFALQGPLHMTMSIDPKELDNQMTHFVENLRFEMTLALTEQKATVMSWLDPAVWKNYLTFEPQPVDSKDLAVAPLFGHRRVAAALSTQLAWIPKDITPQKLLGFLPPEKIEEVINGLEMFGISGEMIISMLRNPMTFTLGDMVDSPIGPMFSMTLLAINVPEQLINQLPIYGTMLSMAFQGEAEDKKPVEFSLPDSSWKGYIVKKPSPFIFAISPDRNLLTGTAPVEVLTTEAAIHPSIKKFMETPHIFALAVDVQAAMESGQALILIPQETKDSLNRLDTITIFSDGDSRATAEINFK